MKKHQYGFSYLIQELFKSPNNILKILMVCIISIFMVFRLFISIPHDVKEYYKIQLPDTHEKYYNHINEILVFLLYLWGIETMNWGMSERRHDKFLLYLWGIETY